MLLDRFCPVESPRANRGFSWSCERALNHEGPHGTPDTRSSERDWLSETEWASEQKSKKAQKPKLRVLHNVGDGSINESGEIRYLAPRNYGEPHVLIDLRNMQGVLEMGIADTRKMHAWLGRFLAYRDSEAPVLEQPVEEET